MRIAIAGGPKTGKTTRAAELALKHGITTVLHSDELIPHNWDWSQVSEFMVRDWFTMDGPLIVEGTRVVHALRKWRASHPDARPPFDQIIFLTEPQAVLTDGQRRMALGIAKIYDELRGWINPAQGSPQSGQR